MIRRIITRKGYRSQRKSKINSSAVVGSFEVVVFQGKLEEMYSNT